MLDVKIIFFSRINLEKLLCVFPAHLSYYCSPLHITVHFAFLVSSVLMLNQMEEEISKKMMRSLMF